MKTLLLFRHAKSDWGAEHETDHERPLAPRGKDAARRMGVLLERLGSVPELALTSSAVRARRTVELAAKAGRWKTEVVVSSELYGASPGEVLDVIRRCADEVSSLLLAGHEPTWSALVAALVGGATLKFPTAAVACIRIPSDSWRAVEFGSGELAWFVPPKLLARIGWPGER